MSTTNPWLALSTYQEKDEKSFLGREEDKKTLFSMLQQNDTVVCYAASGEGKSSLINAGLCPKLRRSDMFPVKIIFATDTDYADFDTVVMNGIQQAYKDYENLFGERMKNLGIEKKGEFCFADASSFSSDDIPKEVAGSLWWKLRTQKIHNPYGGVDLIPVLIFDQFEEIFRTSWKTEFFRWLDKLSNDVCPDEIAKALDGKVGNLPGRKLFKMLFSMRYEYVGELDYWCSQRNFIPQMMRNRYFLKPMSKDDALATIKGNSSVDDPVSAEINKHAEKVVEAIAEDATVDITLAKATGKSDDKDTVPALAISLICYVLYEKIKNEEDADAEKIISLFLNDKKKRNRLVYDFYYRKMLELHFHKHEQIVLEKALISPNVRRLRIPLDDERLNKIDLSKHLEEKVNLATEHIIKTESINNEKYVELVHDSLMNAIANHLHVENRKKRIKLFALGGLLAVLLGLLLLSPAMMRKPVMLKPSLESEAIPLLPELKHYDVDNETFELHDAWAESDFYIESEKVGIVVYDGFDYKKFYKENCKCFVFPNADTLKVESMDDIEKFLGTAFLPNLKFVEIDASPKQLLQDKIFNRFKPLQVQTNTRIRISDSVGEHYHYDNGCLFAKSDNLWFVLAKFTQDPSWLGGVYYDNTLIPQVQNYGTPLQVYDLANPPKTIRIKDLWWSNTYYKIICSDTSRHILEKGAIPDSVLYKAWCADFPYIDTVDTCAFSFCNTKNFYRSELKYINLPRAKSIKDYPCPYGDVKIYAPELCDFTCRKGGDRQTVVFYVDTSKVTIPADEYLKIEPIVQEGKTELAQLPEDHAASDKDFSRKDKPTGCHYSKDSTYHYSEDWQNLTVDSLEVPRLRIRKETNRILFSHAKDSISVKAISVSPFNKCFSTFHGQLMMFRSEYSETQDYGYNVISKDRKRQFGFSIWVSVKDKSRPQRVSFNSITPSCLEFVSLTRPTKDLPTGKTEHVVLKVPYGMKEQYLHSPWNDKFRKIEELGPISTLWYRLCYGKDLWRLKRTVFYDFKADFLPVVLEILVFLLGSVLIVWRKYKAKKREKWIDFLAAAVLFALVVGFMFLITNSFSMWWHFAIMVALYVLWVLFHYDRKSFVGLLRNKRTYQILIAIMLALISIFVAKWIWKMTHELNIKVNGVSIVMQHEKGGTFLMGAQNDDPDGANYDSTAFDYQEPVHRVRVDGFYMSSNSITREQWNEVMGDDKYDPLLPVMVSWYEAVSFCNKLSELKDFTPYYVIDTVNKDTLNQNIIDNLKWTVTCNHDATGFRLPTEAEWEWKFGGNGVYKGDAKNWCYDWYGDYGNDSIQINPQGALGGVYRVFRGHPSRDRGTGFPTWYYGFRIILPEARRGTR